MTAFTAIVSAVAAVVLWRIMPAALAIPSRSEIERVNNQLQDEVKLRRNAEAELVKSNARLERTVTETTQDLEESKYTLRSLIDNSSAVIYMLNTAGEFVLVNKRMASLTGLPQDEILGKRREDLMTQAVAEEHRRNDTKVVAEKTPMIFEENNIEEDGIHYYFTTKFPLLKPDGSVYAVGGISTDITARKQQELALRRADHTRLFTSQCNAMLIYARDEQEILSNACRLAVETGGYLMAWVGFAENDAAKSVRPVVQSGYEKGYLKNINISWANTKLGRGPTGTAIRTGQMVVNQNILTNPSLAPWREAALKRGYRSSIALPLVSGKNVIGALTIYAVEPDAFVDDEVTMLEELARDLGYGIAALRLRREHEQYTTALQRSLEQSVETIAAIVEARDPHTAGHQRRVADLAVAIARQMSLPEEQIKGIHLAASIHDFGKIRVPAEILAKPSRLSETEFEFVKAHSQAGYDILKDVKFPWPIADMILQHHEKLDGSGYPQGLVGDQILVQARILTVADVVEAMSSHRPYRAALGVDTALSEITAGRGVAYDPAVVDACVSLFKERAYQLPV